MSGRFNNLTGQTFGSLTVKRHAGFRLKKHRWHCQCVCGIACIRTTQALKSGSPSCGCQTVERRRQNAKETKAAAVKMDRAELTTSEKAQVERILGGRTGEQSRIEAIQLVVIDRRHGDMACHGGYLARI